MGINRRTTGSIRWMNSKYRRCLRIKLFEEQKGVCHLIKHGMCHEPDKLMDLSLDPYDPLYPTFDHIEIHSAGGGSSKENIPLAHRVCNEKRGTKCLSQK